MSTTSPAGHHDAVVGRADAAAVLAHLVSGRPLDSALVERVRTQAAQITADIEREHGLVDDETFQSLLDEET
jgi:hypothetical protein